MKRKSAESGIEPYYFDQLLRDLSESDRILFSHLKFEIDEMMYYFGGHFIRPYESSPISRLRDQIAFLRMQLRNMRIVNSSDSLLFSSAYFGMNEILRKSGANVFFPPWLGCLICGVDDLYLAGAVIRMKTRLKKSGLKNITSSVFLSDLKSFRKKMKDYFIRKKASALIIPSDLPFFDSLAADIFQEIGKPSAVALHGIPGYYTLKHYNSKTDYLLVWGQKVKRLFIEAGCPTKRILVTGHPDLSGRRPEIKRNTTENILVLSKSMPGVPNDYFPVFSDRSATLTYAHLVRKALMAVGIRRVRFRPHPSENPHWYESHLDPDFFEVVTGSLRQELLNASLVIGPSSTAFFDAVYAGTNYLIFEPLKAGKDIFGYPVASPFDGRDRSFQVAQSDSELLRLLSILPLPPQSALEQYISPVFNRNFLKQMVSA